ncbi:hypothetical protein HY469_00605, partial [Candidatus Roizmanbacteria bacterium]|nr:hypothetical protein [Candidatus Roizmanbacteria bacterium]
ILTLDGHRVRSLAEATIDNWLFSNRIIHAYEKEISRDKESWFCDFSIPTESNSLVYVELWGLEDEKYVKRKQHKLSLYKKYNLRLVELDLKDLEKLDEVMKKRLSSHSKISVLS